MNLAVDHTVSDDCIQNHWRRLVKNIGRANSNVGEKNVIKISQMLGTRAAPRLPPKSTPMLIRAAAH